MHDIWKNVVLGISLAAPIGPSGVAIIQNGLQGGFRRAFLTSVGVTSADTTYLLVVYLGLSGLMAHEEVRIVIWAIGALALMVLGYRSIDNSARNLDGASRAGSLTRNPLLVGYVVNISNPIAVVWWVGIFGGLLATAGGGGYEWRALLNSSTILLGILAWHTSVSALTHWGRRFLNQTISRYISIGAGCVLILFGLRFAYHALAALIGRAGG